jgi:hypothetical protein
MALPTLPSKTATATPQPKCRFMDIPQPPNRIDGFS